MELSLILKAQPFNIIYGNVKIKQCSNVAHLGCILGETLCGNRWCCAFLIKSSLDLGFIIDKIDL